MELDEYLKKRGELQQALHQNAQRYTQEFFLQFFMDHPEVQGVRWTQYTPYFNDGEACIFVINDPSYTFDPNPEETLEDPDTEEASVWLDSWGMNTKYKDEPWFKGAGIENLDAISARLNEWEDKFSAMDLIFEELGDHSRITVMRGDNITLNVEDYDHD
jgi:hypothetical protein